MADRRRARGQAGEGAAAAMLAAQGYDVVERNFRTRYGELDIVAIDRDCLVFCEVRTRVGRTNGIALALESVGAAKQLQLRKMATEWLRLGRSRHRPTRAMRFDVVAVAIATDGRPLAMRHVTDAF